MNAKKLNILMRGLAILSVLVFVISIVFGSQYLSSHAKELNEAKLNLESLNEQQTALSKAKRDLEKYENLQTISKRIVPQDKDQAKSVREIVRFAQESDVKIASINFAASTLGLQQSPRSSNNGGSSNGNSGSSSSTPPITQAKPVPGIKGVYAIEIAIESEKENNQYGNFLRFLEKLENNRRTAQVSQVKVTPGRTTSGFDYIDFSLKVNIFVKP